ncbi:MAG: TlpA disulfide reductase family protein [Thalassobaculum sp.]
MIAVLALVTLAGSAWAGSAPAGFAVYDTPKPLPEIRFVDGGGQQRTLGGFRGRTLLVNIWATWCVPCREEMPTLDRLQGELGGSGFEVVALSIDRAGIAVVDRFYNDIGVRHLARYIDSSGKAARTLGTYGLPTTLLIDSSGREIGRLVGAAEWDAAEMVAFIRMHLSVKTGGYPPAPTTRAEVVSRTVKPGARS